MKILIADEFLNKQNLNELPQLLKNNFIIMECEFDAPISIDHNYNGSKYLIQ